MIRGYQTTDNKLTINGNKIAINNELINTSYDSIIAKNINNKTDNINVNGTNITFNKLNVNNGVVIVNGNTKTVNVNATNKNCNIIIDSVGINNNTATSTTTLTKDDYSFNELSCNNITSSTSIINEELTTTSLNCPLNIGNYNISSSITSDQQIKLTTNNINDKILYDANGFSIDTLTVNSINDKTIPLFDINGKNISINNSSVDLNEFNVGKTSVLDLTSGRIGLDDNWIMESNKITLSGISFVIGGNCFNHELTTSLLKTALLTIEEYGEIENLKGSKLTVGSTIITNNITTSSLESNSTRTNNLQTTSLNTTSSNFYTDSSKLNVNGAYIDSITTSGSSGKFRFTQTDLDRLLDIRKIVADIFYFKLNSSYPYGIGVKHSREGDRSNETLIKIFRNNDNVTIGSSLSTIINEAEALHNNDTTINEQEVNMCRGISMHYTPSKYIYLGCYNEVDAREDYYVEYTSGAQTKIYNYGGVNTIFTRVNKWYMYSKKMFNDLTLTAGDLKKDGKTIAILIENNQTNYPKTFIPYNQYDINGNEVESPFQKGYNAINTSTGEPSNVVSPALYTGITIYAQMSAYGIGDATSMHYCICQYIMRFEMTDGELICKLSSAVGNASNVIITINTGILKTYNYIFAKMVNRRLIVGVFSMDNAITSLSDSDTLPNLRYWKCYYLEEMLMRL